MVTRHKGLRAGMVKGLRQAGRHGKGLRQAWQRDIRGLGRHGNDT